MRGCPPGTLPAKHASPTVEERASGMQACSDFRPGYLFIFSQFERKFAHFNFFQKNPNAKLRVISITNVNVSVRPRPVRRSPVKVVHQNPSVIGTDENMVSPAAAEVILSLTFLLTYYVDY